MFRPWLRTARPDDWIGVTAQIAMGAALFLFMVPALLARLPRIWEVWTMGYPELVRIVWGLLVLYLWGWARAIVVSRLPRAPYLFGRHLVYSERGRKHKIPVELIRSVYVQMRPAPEREVFAFETLDGERHDLCPVHWFGAPRLYAGLARKVRRARRRRISSARRGG